jgi:biopolymer transport protein ExbD
MAAQSSQNGAIIAGINVTPLVDIMLVLLIIFLVTAHLAVVPPKGLPLNLPNSATAETVQLVFAIALYEGGKATVNGRPIGSDEELLPMARLEHQAHPEVRAVVQADGKVFHERVVHAIDLLSQAGISQIAFGVTLPPAASAGTPAGSVTP